MKGLHWRELLGANGKPLWVLTDSKSFFARVVPYGNRSWQIQLCDPSNRAARWQTVRGNPRGFYHVRCARSWRSAEAARTAAQDMVRP